VVIYLFKFFEILIFYREEPIETTKVEVEVKNENININMNRPLSNNSGDTN